MNKNNEISIRRLKAIFAIILGSFMLVWSVIAVLLTTAPSYHGTYIVSETYGGDAYTGMQNASAETGNNVVALGHLINDIYIASSFLIASVLFPSGILVIVYNSIKLSKLKKE